MTQNVISPRGCCKIKRFIKVSCLTTFEKFHFFMKKSIRRCVRVRHDRIAFMSSPDFSDNARAMFEYLEKNGYLEKYTCYWFAENPKELIRRFGTRYPAGKVRFFQSRMGTHRKLSLRSFIAAQSCGIAMYTHNFLYNCDETPAGQRLIRLWHGCGYKKSNIPHERNLKARADVVLVPGPYFVPLKSEFFEMPEEAILPIGYPRYDWMLTGSEAGKAFCRKLRGNAGKLVMWMPTFRSTGMGYSEDKMKFAGTGLPLIDSREKLEELDQYCGEIRVHLVLKKHRVQTHYDIADMVLKHIIYMDDTVLGKADLSLYELLPYSDALISDYSSISIDYLLLDKPLGFVLDDFEVYSKVRGFITDNVLEYMPGAHIKTVDDMKRFLTDVAAGRDEYGDDRARVRREVHNPCVCYCKRLLDFLRL